MTATRTPAPSPVGMGDRLRRARSTGAGAPSAPVRRRWGRVVAGVAAVLIGAWVFTAIYLSAGDRVDVVVVARAVEQEQVLERADLRVARIGSSGEGVATVPAGDIDDMVGRRAAADLPEGAVLARGQVRSSDERVVKESDAVVGVLAAAGGYPAGMSRGDDVYVVVRPAQGETGTVAQVDGWMYRVDARPLNSGERPLEVVVSRDDVAAVSAAAAEGRVTIVALDG